MHAPSSIHSVRGLTLAEVAMAMFIIGVGVLSIATVYLQNERTASVTAQQSTAHRLADTMAQRIKAHQNPNVRFENPIGVRCANAPANVLVANPQIQAFNEVACWQEAVAADLPSGAGSIALDESTVPPNYAITVSWLQPRGGLASYQVRVATQVAKTAAPPLPANALSKSSEARAAN
jgi:type IV pilus modification protein PilV